MNTEELPGSTETQRNELRDRLVKDQGLAETQLKAVLKHIEEVQVAQQTLTKQKIALETLINYLRTVLNTQEHKHT